MILQKPEVEFVNIDFNEVVTASSPTGGGQRCVATQEQAESCEVGVVDSDWGNPEN